MLVVHRAGCVRQSQKQCTLLTACTVLHAQPRADMRIQGFLQVDQMGVTAAGQSLYTHNGSTDLTGGCMLETWQHRLKQMPGRMVATNTLPDNPKRSFFLKGK